MEQATVDIKLVDKSGKSSGVYQGSSQVFGRRARPAIFHEVVRWQRAGWRAGTHSVLTRAEASGGGAKPWKQKGTGRARAGSNTSPLWVGGGIAHGPKPRDYSFSLNKKQRKLALKGVLSARVSEDKLMVVDSLELAQPKTKLAREMLDKLGMEKGKRVAVILGKDSETSFKALRNLHRVRTMTVEGVNVYDLMASEYVVIAKSAVEALESRVIGNAKTA